MTRDFLRRVAPCLFAVAVLALAGCGGSGGAERDPATGGPTRPFMMGFSTTPRELNADAYADTFRLAAEHGEVVLIQRTPPWQDFLPGASISEETARTTADERRAVEDGGLRLFFAIDPTDGASGRDRIAGLPASLSGRTFGDPDVQAAFVAYAEYVALNYRPDYLALGVEMNLYYHKNKDDFESFKALYAAAYDAVKKTSPGTRITVTMQHEDLAGILPTEDKHFPDWQLLRAFEPKFDFAAISTYPTLAFATAGAIPDTYYTQLRAFTDRPIAIAQMGYSSAAGVQGQNSGTEQDQAAYLRRVLGEAEDMDMPFLIWFAGWDPSYANDGAFSAFRHIGLLRDDLSEKPGWALWSEAARRPYEAR